MEPLTPSPEPKAWLISAITFSWINPLLKLAKNQTIEIDDLFLLPPEESTRRRTQKFQDYWQRKVDGLELSKENQKKFETALKWSIWHVVRMPILVAGLYRFLNTLTQVAVPIVVAELLGFIEEIDDRPLYEGFVLCGVLGGLSMLKALIENTFFWLVFRAGWQARSVISSAVFNKSLRLSASARQSLSQGQIVNLMQLDAEKIERYGMLFHVFWDSLLQMLGYSGVIFFYIQESVFVGLAVPVVLIPFQICVLLLLFKYIKSYTKATDERVKLSNETLISILAIKSAGWETNFRDRINGIRKKELMYLKKVQLIASIGIAFVITVPTLMAAAALAYFGLTRGDGAVSAAILFASIQAFNSLRFPLLQIPGALSGYINAKVSQKRLAAFFSLEESSVAKHAALRQDDEEDEEKVVEVSVKVTAEEVDESEDEDVVVEVTDGEFFWSTGEVIDNFLVQSERPKSAADEEPVEAVCSLREIDFKVKRGALVGVVGPVGSGKSTLMNAILGELTQTKGSLKVKTSAAFAAQTAWIQNATLKDNILFGEDEDVERYRTVLEVCQLKSDLDILEDGDMTEIGERGINLSGGQSQRVSVARAAYSQNELVLLDDPLSALDPEVAAKLFEDCIVEFLSDRTRVMVTNQLNFLESCDYIIGLGSCGDGSVTNTVLFQGEYKELLKNSEAFALMISSFSGEEENEKRKSNKRKSAKVQERYVTKVDEVDVAKKLIEEEERETGTVSFGNYWSYIKTGGICLFLIAVVLLAVANFSTLLNLFALSIWANDAEYEENELEFYIGLYVGSAVVSSFFFFLQTFTFLYFGLRVSRKFHDKLLKGILRAPMSFFDTTPTGRVVSRFSRDIFSLDTELPGSLIGFLLLVGFLIASLFVIISQVPLFLALIPFLLVVYCYFMRTFRPLAIDVKRIESISRSPIYAHFGETISGLQSIRAFNKTQKFIDECEFKIDNSLKATYALKALQRWISVRLELTSAVVIAITSSLIVYGASEGQLDPGTAGVVLSMTLAFTGIIGGLIQGFVNLETVFNSVERITHYSNNIAKEKPFLSDTPPEDNWPTKGEIVLNDVVMRYRDETPIVLKGVSLTIPGGSTCGVVGRTGCGKSSLMLTLLRIVEAEGGSITIDGINIAEIGLHELRQKVSMVPQSPVMFSGTVRLNLDPFQRYNDDELWTVLEQVNLEEHVASLAGKLDSEVVEYGENFSQGQRQLMCMARSLLANAKVLLLDEATSSVDYETDAVIQATIRKQFVDCTILTIAHRVQTIADYDNVLVMDNGRVGEFGPPATLLENADSEFSKIVSEMGPAMEAKLRNSILS